jgi:ribonuclease E
VVEAAADSAEEAADEAVPAAAASAAEIVEEPMPAPSGLTAEGRAGNDPRVEANPVGTVEITTTHVQLFPESVAPAVVPSGRLAARASNDPRGPLSAQPDANSADDSGESAAQHDATTASATQS